MPDDELRIEIKGELAGILELCQEGTKREPGGLSTAGLAEQIKMVAGARNRLDLLLSAAIFATLPQPGAASSASNGPFTAVIIQR